ncbi:MAG TPA: fused MFS/spermidine synthase [Terriglobales bacterium]
MAIPSRSRSGSLSWFFVFFFVSGFCSILYELIWLRLAMAQFGVTTPLVSTVLSMFMAGLGLGSWLAGRFVRNYDEVKRVSALRLYALTELLIGVSAIVVPYQLAAGRTLLVQMSLSSSFSYYLASGFCIGVTLLPWCACMGATIPFAMLAIRNRFPEQSERSFSFLYLANVLGAVAGSAIPLLLIELYGFRGTLKVGAAFNLLLALAATALSFKLPALAISARQGGQAPVPVLQSSDSWKLLALLFGTGCTSMGIEVVWIRQFTPYIGTVVYAFAQILGIYLLFTFIGSRIYRRTGAGFVQSSGLAWVILGTTAVLSTLAASPSFPVPRLLRLPLGVAPFSAVAGFLTPMLVDRWSGGDPDRAGSAYAVNVVGCILGPLLSGFLLLPWLSERWVLILFALPWLIVGAAWPRPSTAPATSLGRQVVSYALIVLAILTPFLGEGFGEQFTHKAEMRDSTATVIAMGEGMNRRLLVNGIGMTALTPVTKMMAHLPLTMLDHPPKKALIICFGMGTTYRSFLSWGIPTTVVELVPSVPRLFWFYHSDADQVLQSPLGHVVIDDGRRYLERTDEKFDVIAIDPPPPVQAAGSSLLYTKEFYASIRQHLAPGGFLQQWLPGGDLVTVASVARALAESFPYVRTFHSVEGWGIHFTASDQPIPSRTPEEMVARMPPAAITDLMEWGPQATPEKQFAVVLNSEFPISQVVALAPAAPAMADNRPVNEYYFMRKRLGPGWQRFLGNVGLPSGAAYTEDSASLAH